MDKRQIRNFAVWARRELIDRVRMRAQGYGITEHDIGNADVCIIEDRPLTERESEMRGALVQQIRRDGYAQTIESVAYTWFNRFCALRFMEVNGYLPSRVRVFSDEQGAFRPQILSDAIHLEGRLENIDIEKVFEMKEADQNDALYKYLLIAQCDALKAVLPVVFTKIEDYTELLFPDRLLDPASVIGRMITDIPEDYFRVDSAHGQIEIIGWLYQYYISERHEEVIDPLHGKFIRAEDIPAATQLFTTDWVVRYIVDNTVGRYWIEHHPESRLAESLAFYVPQADGSPRGENISPSDVTVFDPCVGSGHFLVYAIDVLMMIYREYGYSDRDAIAEIIRHNLCGVDIDERAVELAYFAVMMKGCQYDKRFLKRGIQPRVYAVADSRFADEAFMTYLGGSNKDLQRDVAALMHVMENAFETGSLIQIPAVDFAALEDRLNSLSAQKDLFYAKHLETLGMVLNTARLLSGHYAAVVTNPPYLNKYDASLKKYLQENYKEYSGDLFSVFIYRCMLFSKSGGYAGLMTPNVWMFIKSYAKLRQYLLRNHSITTLVQMAKGAFFSEATVDVCAFVLQCARSGKTGVYFRLEEFLGNMDYQAQKLCEALNDPSCRYRYQTKSSLFETLPGMQIGYWACEAILDAFRSGQALETHASPRQGMATTDNNTYLRRWYEVAHGDIGFGLDRQAAVNSDIKWFPYNKGGEFRKWYGNQEYIVNYQHDGQCIKRDVLAKYPYLKTPDFVVKNPDTYFDPCLSWSKISSGSVSFRYFPQGFLYDVSGCSIFFERDDDLYYYAGFLNSMVCAKILEIISPTLNYETGHIGMLPIIDSAQWRASVAQRVEANIRLSAEDWGDFETSWTFAKHPLI
ncbi:MAG: BREX-1 system adenine-specific DNA-methyltransferase PglX [Proteobacteria bacterium]|nr:BREX-1 system adenine-specific DNA-methyltransferase PglX [Pseudomonadota bacterium]